MDTVFIKELDDLEQTHWWHIAKRELVLNLFKRFFLTTKSNSPISILEIGAGAGGILQTLKPYGHTTALDLNPAALDFCKKKGIDTLIEGSFTEYTGFVPSSYDVIVACDIIEHIEADGEAVKRMFSLLKNEGVGIVHVPANSALFSYWDEMMGHYRRYDWDVLKKLFEDQGFSIVCHSYRISFLYPFILLFRKVKQLLNSDTKGKPSDFTYLGFMNGVFLFITRIENFLISRFSVVFPFGLSLVLVARKSAK